MKKLLLFLALAAAGLQGRATDYYLVGGATIGWTDNALARTPARATQTGDNSYAWAGKIKAFDADNDDATRFKIPQGGNYDYGIWASETNQHLTESPSTITYKNDGDKKFCVTEEGYYLVSFNTSTHQITAKKLTEPSKDGNYYLISNTNDYYWFAGYIASDATKNAKARLTADISFKDKDFVCLASERYKFSGEFDGGGHTIDYAITKCSYGNVGLFTFIEQGANIHDLVIGSNSSFWGTQNVGGIAGNAYGSGTVTLRNVINCAAVHAQNEGYDTNSAGFVAYADADTNISATNCANLGHTSTNGGSAKSAAFVGWIETSATFTNCWNGDAISDMDNNQNLYRKKTEATCTLTNCYDASGVASHIQGTKLGTGTKGSGELCHKLNGDANAVERWYQNLSGTKDDFPLPFNTQSKVSKSNTSYTNLTVSGGNVQIGTANDLKTFAAEVAAGQTTLNAELTTDINYSASTYQGTDAMIGTSTNKYAGTFDGNNKTVTIGFNVEDNDAGLFRYVNNGTIKKLKVTGSITTTKQYAGGICARISKNGIITNCESAVTISDTNDENHDGTHGGILALIDDLGDDSSVEVKNCIFSGAFDASKCHGCGGVVGWTGNKSSKVQIKNNLVTGTFNLQDNNDVDTDERKSDVFYRSSATPDNNFYTCNLSNNLRNSSGATSSTEIKKTKGELCYKLNGDQTTINWYQSIGTDAYPVPFNTSQQVYQVVADESYTNFATANINSTTHAVKIGTSDQLEKFSKEVNAGNNAMNAELTADITGVTSHTPIGTETYKYKGTFDGDGKSITFDINTNQDCQALVGHATGGITIQNLILKGSVTSTGSKTAGFIAETKGSGTVTITNCGNEATISGGGGETAAIVANNNGSSPSTLNLTNVYNTGDVSGSGDVSTISAFAAWSNFKNVYNSGNVTGAGYGKFVRNSTAGNYSTYENCYSTIKSSYDDASVVEINTTNISSGELCYKLGHGTTSASIWKQTIGTDNYPKLFGSTGVVNQVVADKSYSNLTVSESDDKVEIGSLANLNQFSAEVNAGNVEMDAILTSNITDNGTFTPIGTETYKYKGTFDGDDHYVQLAINKSGTPFQGLFGCATGGAKFKNLIIKGNVIGGNNSAALVGQVGGNGESGTITINRVGCEVNVSGSYEHHGAFVGNDWGGSVKLEVENSYNIGDISGSSTTYTSVMGSWIKPESSYTNVFNSGTITGNKFSHQNRGNCTNCYTTTSGAGEVSNLVQGVTSDQITSGKLCYLLNGSTQGGTNWYQNLTGSVDAHPVFFSDHKKVYQYNTSKYVNNGDKVEIGDATDLANFAALVNAGATSVDADQTADIDFSTQSAAGVMIGDNKDNAYSGTYDGQAHEIKVTYTSSANNTALFRYISNANLKNIITTGSITTNGEYSCSGGIFAAVENGSDESVVENCLSYVNFIYSDATNRDKTFGGIGAYMRNKGTIQNCAFLGEFNAPNAYGNGGILGYAHSSDVTVKNCYVKASVINVAAKDGDHESKIIVRNKVPSDCYYVSIGNFENQTSGANPVTSDDVTSGKLCYDLGSAWYQDLTIDDYPVPFDTHSKVYRRGEPSSYSYSNITTGSTVKIKSAKDLIDFSALVNEGNYNLNAELTNDIDMTDKSWTPIGTSTNKYAGTFDGQYKTIKLNINTTQDNQALFGIATADTEIKNLIVEGSVTARQRAAGLIGYADGDGTITLTNIINKASIDATASTSEANAAGLVGCAVNGIIIKATNCGNTGKISNSGYTDGTQQCAAFAGWLNKEGTTFTNCWNIGEISNMEGKAQLYRNSQKGSAINCYYLIGESDQGEKLDATAAYTGELCYLLKGSQETNAFTQAIGTDDYPTFGSATVDRGQWFGDDYIYYNVDESDNITVNELNLDDTKTVYSVPANVRAKSVTLTRTISAGKWNTFCSPVAIEKSNFSAAKELTGVTVNGDNYSMTFTDVEGDVLEAGKPYMVQVSEDKTEFTATDVEVAAEASTSDTFSGLTFNGVFTSGYAPQSDEDNSYFIISNNAFYEVDSEVSLKAFRGYITVASGSSVKALSFDFEDDADGIEMVNGQSSMVNDPIYNLAGQRIGKMQRGINIVNGKKILK